MKYITILDFFNGGVYQYDIQKQNLQSTDDMETFICDEGHDLNNIQWMAHEDKTIITNE